MLLRFLREWNGHSEVNSTYALIEDLQAIQLIREGIAEPAKLGEVPHVPFNFVETARGYSGGQQDVSQRH